MEKLIDDGPIIDIESRSILDISDMHQVVVAGDNNSQLITFSVFDRFDKANVLDKNIWIKYLNVEGFGDKVPAVDKRKEKAKVQVIDDITGEVQEEKEVDVVRFGWIIDQNVTSEAGKVAFAIEITGPSYKWSTMDAVLNVEDTVHVEDSLIVPEQTWMQQFEVLLEEILATGKTYIEKIKQETDALKTIAEDASETATTQAEISERQAEISTEKAIEVTKIEKKVKESEGIAIQKAEEAQSFAIRAEEAATRAEEAENKIPVDPISIEEIDALT